MMRKKNKFVIPVLLFVVFIGALIVFLLPSTDVPKVCLNDTKLCSDGSYVSRELPDCVFVACPVSVVNTTFLPVLSDKKWVMSFNDEFSGNSIDKSKWNGGYSQLPWCPPWSNGSGNCANQYSGVTVSDGVLKLQSRVTSINPLNYENRAMINSGGANLASAKFGQKFGFFDVRAKFPTNKNGEGDGLWFAAWGLPFGKNYASQNLPVGQQHEEVDWLEAVLRNNYDSLHRYTASLHDYSFNQYHWSVPAMDSGDLSAEFHNYGLYWRDDGSKFGSMQVYFDGVAQGSPIVLDARSNWGEGIYIILQMISCPWTGVSPTGGACGLKTSGDNPFIIDYVRVYKEVPK